MEPEEYTPIAELKYWEEVESEFNSLLEQLKLPFVVGLLNKMEQSKAEVFKPWPKLLKDVIDFHHLAKENSEYLQTLKDYLIVRWKDLKEVLIV